MTALLITVTDSRLCGAPAERRRKQRRGAMKESRNNSNNPGAHLDVTSELRYLIATDRRGEEREERMM
jgi:hypothetical protein